MRTENEKSKKIENMKDIVAKIHKSIPDNKDEDKASVDTSKHTEAYSNMRVRALKYIGIDRGKSFDQVARVLRRNFPEESSDLIETVIDDLIFDQFIDEHLCGRRLIKRHSGRKQKSKIYIKHLMFRQGITQSVINDLLTELDSDEKTASNYFYEKIEEWDFQNPEKIIRHFSSRGYSSGVILKIMRKYKNE